VIYGGAIMSFSDKWIDSELQNDELEIHHRSPDVEYSFYNAVKTGDMDTVIRNCEENAFINLEGTGVLSRNPLTNIKYHFVVTAAMLTRYCIEGGLEPELAYRLSDFYILKMDDCTTIQQVADLHHSMVKDFTGKMILQKKRAILSKPVVKCVDYIYSHINERITVQMLADYTGLSANYLSRVFKQNLGISISDYIREKKIEKATQLLRYSDQSIVDIANYLSFSSQSHFIQIFEKFMGLTPKKYRDKYYKSML
jgi:AraC-like DNA-binding protein